MPVCRNAEGSGEHVDGAAVAAGLDADRRDDQIRFEERVEGLGFAVQGHLHAAVAGGFESDGVALGDAGLIALD